MNIVFIGGSSTIAQEFYRYLKKNNKNNRYLLTYNNTRLENYDTEDTKIYKINLSNFSHISKLVNVISNYYPNKVDIIIFFASSFKFYSKKIIKKDNLIKDFTINLFSPYKIIQSLLNKNLFKKNSKIIFMQSSLFQDDYKFIEYSASKYALYSIQQSFSEIFSKKNIYINSVLPGRIHSSINNYKILLGKKKIGKKNFINAVNTKKNKDTHKMKIDKILNLLSFLISKKSDGVTNRIISAQFDNFLKNKLKIKNNKSDIYRYKRLDN